MFHVAHLLRLLTAMVVFAPLHYRSAAAAFPKACFGDPPRNCRGRADYLIIERRHVIQKQDDAQRRVPLIGFEVKKNLEPGHLPQAMLGFLTYAVESTVALLYVSADLVVGKWLHSTLVLSLGV